MRECRRPRRGRPRRRSNESACWGSSASGWIISHGSAVIANFAGLRTARIKLACGTDFRRRHPARDVAHLLADVVVPGAGREGFELGAQIDYRLSLEPGCFGLTVKRTCPSAKCMQVIAILPIGSSYPMTNRMAAKSAASAPSHPLRGLSRLLEPGCSPLLSKVIAVRSRRHTPFLVTRPR